MKSEVTLIFEENDGTLNWLFNIISYAHHISDAKVKGMLEPMMKEFLHQDSYNRLLELSEKNISEEELISEHLNKGVIKFSSPKVTVRGPKIKAMCYMIEQAGAMQEAAAGEDVPENVLALFKGHQGILDRIKIVITEALQIAGAKGVQIEKFSSQ
ncbi:hypothetical protein I5M27_02185 [Adhaeribacter sp. BT258]|uniref:Uncharacterized protein n=1 Tax=Adhaeribacter terrigena TaxID=2793070 RepID=A0ABS1BXH1_9BACT|nr:hypothetical protein [Adhaeribacter terrigena]MBK0401774.1 hypothetical protein [Adhaeribacter terrigena]